jgi:tight adherence protein B
VLGSGALLAGGWLLAGPVAGVLLATGGPALVGQAVAAHRRRWRRELAEGVPAVARALADALSGGHSVRGGLIELGRIGALPGPATVELRAAARRLALGEPTDVVLEHVRRRGGDPAWDTLIAAILLQRRAGGDLATLLRSIAASREHARRVEAEARGLTAQARATAKLLGGLPILGFGLTAILAPGLVAALIGDPRSRVLLIAALVIGAFGIAVVRRLARGRDA